MLKISVCLKEEQLLSILNFANKRDYHSACGSTDPTTWESGTEDVNKVQGHPGKQDPVSKKIFLSGKACGSVVVFT